MTEKGDDPLMRRDSVVSGMPVDSEADRRVMPAAESRDRATPEMAREMDSGCSMWSSVVPTWNRSKYPGGKSAQRFWYLAALCGYLFGMDNRERSPWSESVAAQIRAERAAASLTQDELVALSGIPRSTYIRLERGQRVADVSQLARICGALELPLSEFWQRVEARYPESD
jgi:DNA-binding XRE family transcriptional regulator